MYSDKVMDHFEASEKRGRDRKQPAAWELWEMPNAEISCGST